MEKYPEPYFLFSILERASKAEMQVAAQSAWQTLMD